MGYNNVFHEMSNDDKPSDFDLFHATSPLISFVFFPWRWIFIWLLRRFNLYPALFFTSRGSIANRQFINSPRAIVLVEGIFYGESPRFRFQENALYYADAAKCTINKFSFDTWTDSCVYTHWECVSGIGWLPNGRLLFVSMDSHKLCTIDEHDSNSNISNCKVYADMSSIAKCKSNDMVVHDSGRAYIGNFGFDFRNIFGTLTTTIVQVDPNRTITVEKISDPVVGKVAATDMFFPNGSVITPDGKRLIVAETFRGQLTVFDINQSNGSLTNRRVWADLGIPLDGICLDAEGYMWVAINQVGAYKTAGALARVKEGGEIVELFGFGRNGIDNSVIACQLGTIVQTGEHYLFFLDAGDDFYAAYEKSKLTGINRGRITGTSTLKMIKVPVGPARKDSNPSYCGGYC